MPGTLSATVNIFAPQAVGGALGASGQLDTGGFMPIVPVAADFAAGGSLAATVAVRADASAVLYGAGVMAATFSQIYPVVYKPTGGKGTGTFSATGYNNFTPYNDTTSRATTNVPIGTQGCWITLTGPGGKGGAGYSATLGTAKGGGAGGGGGGRVLRSFISRAQLGTTYSCHQGGSGAGDATTFTSGGKTVSAGAGGDGASGGTTNAGGAGGTVSTGGFTGLSTSNGGAGGQGGTGGASSGNAPGGGGAGGLGNAFGTASNPGASGASPGGAGGTGNVSVAGTGGTAGGSPGGGGGGGGGGNPGGGGAFGANGDLLIEWV